MAGIRAEEGKLCGLQVRDGESPIQSMAKDAKEGQRKGVRNNGGAGVEAQW